MSDSAAALAVLARLAPVSPVDIDDLISEIIPPSRAMGQGVFFLADHTAIPERAEQAAAAPRLGFKVREPIADPANVARRLAVLSLEKSVEVIVLSLVDNCGLERFGFRVERISGQTEREHSLCEAQLRSFWNIGLVI